MGVDSTTAALIMLGIACASIAYGLISAGISWLFKKLNVKEKK